MSRVGLRLCKRDGGQLCERVSTNQEQGRHRQRAPRDLIGQVQPLNSAGFGLQTVLLEAPKVTVVENSMMIDVMMTWPIYQANMNLLV